MANIGGKVRPVIRESSWGKRCSPSAAAKYCLTLQKHISSWKGGGGDVVTLNQSYSTIQRDLRG